MKRIAFFVLFIVVSVLAMGQSAQDMTVKFIGKLNGNHYQRLDSVRFTNLTRGWSETIIYPDTTIVLNAIVNVNDNEFKAAGFEQNVPNPFDCNTSVDFSVLQDENVRLQLFDAAGKQCAELNVALNAGSHKFEITASKPQAYILKAVAGAKTYSVRMINVGSCGGDGIRYSGKADVLAKFYTENEFFLGDNIEYVGFANIDGETIESERFTQPLVMSQEVILQFTHYSRPSVETLSASGIQTNQAKLYGSISSDGGAPIISRGFVYGTEIYNLSEDVASSSSSTSFNKTIQGLSDATTYYYRAYAVNEAGTGYGDVMSFTTDVASSLPTGFVDGYGYVDLGLPSGMKWAVCNLGATNPEDYGNYYAWGETETKNSYSWGTYIYCNGESNRLTKYCSSPIYGDNGYVDNLSFLEASDDAATVNMGEAWRLPTSEELNELFSSCTMSYTVQNGISGCLVTGPNNNGIFLPNAGYMLDGDVYNAVSFGYYWANSMDVSSPQYSWMLNSNSSNASVDVSDRFKGFTIRPVCMHDPDAQPVAPTVVTGTASNITITGATLSGYISSNGGSQVVSSGFVYGTSQDDLSQSIEGDASLGGYNLTITDLLGDTTYYYKAFATNSEGVGYGEVRSFRTASYSPATGIVDGYGYVDLGLPSGTLWATCNVGANNPDDFGNYYAWAETETKELYTIDTYRYYTNLTSYSSGFTKYCTEPSYGSLGFTDNKIVLDLQDDAATVNMGANWRTPTPFEYNELRNNCSIEYTTQNGVNGALYTGPNGNSIFLPAAGRRLGTNLYNANDIGHYWLDFLSYVRSDEASDVYFNRGTCDDNYSEGRSFRYYGYSVRPVCKSLRSSQESYVPTVLTVSSSGVTAMGAVINGYVVADGGADVASRGFVYGTSGGSLNRTIECGEGTGEFAKQLENLSPSTTYYYKAYAVNSEGTAYGDVKSFTTSEQGQIAGYANGYGYVDLGLPSGTLWATRNVGAISETGYGDFYAWGETEPKETYSADSYIYSYGSSESYTKYSVESQYGYQGFVDSLITLEPMDDAATVHWGACWRMPSSEEKEELRENCSMVFASRNGVVGTLITGPNGNSIFMPAAGFWSNNHYCEEGTTCAYWCNSLCFQFGHYTNSYAGSALFRRDNFPSSCTARSYGYTVRPVRAFPQGSQTTEIPSVQTMSVSNVMVNNATLNGNVVAEGMDLLSLGFVYGTSENNLSCIIECAIVDGDYTATLVGLSSGTTYYYKAFATNSAGTAYGAVMSFETGQQDGPEISYFTDSRDGNTYAMVTIGNQTWMAENLRYADGIDVGLSSSTTVARRFYPDNVSSNVSIYGYLYNWPAAMNGENSSAENPSGVQGICPSGWHLPSNSEWQQLCDALGGNNLDVHYNNPGSQLAGHAELWQDGFLDRAENFGVTGFNALPAGGYSPSDGGYCFGFDGCAYFWTSTELEESANHVRVWGMNCGSTSFGNNYYTKNWGYSVRCVLNE